MRAWLKRQLQRAYRAGQPPATLRCPERIHGLDRISSLHPSAQLSVRQETAESKSEIRLGRDVYIGKDVEITAYGPGSIIIGDDTSFQDRCQIYGDIEIGAHCIFARNVLAISTAHQTTYRPNWLIRDQDEQFDCDMKAGRVTAGHKIRIEDDCWIGWGSAIMPGVYIGRGAIIGANSVVTRDVAPYESHGGAPNRKLGERLIFSPPRRLDALDDDCLPYFYSGFHQRQKELAQSRRQGTIDAGPEAMVVLPCGSGDQICVVGINCSQAPLILIPTLNGSVGPAAAVEPGHFNVTFPVSAFGPPQAEVPSPLRAFFLFGLRSITKGSTYYGLCSVEVIN